MEDPQPLADLLIDEITVKIVCQMCDGDGDDYRSGRARPCRPCNGTGFRTSSLRSEIQRLIREARADVD